MLPRLPAAISSLTLLLQPAAAMLLAAVVLSERPTLAQIAGAVVVCTGVLAVSLSASSPRRDRPSGRARDRAPEHTAPAPSTSLASAR